LGTSSLTKDQEQEISRLLVKIKSAPLEVKDNKFKPESQKLPIQKLVYILDPDKKFVFELTNELAEAGYNLHSLNNFSDLLKRLKEQKLPAALIVDTQYLGINEIHQLSEVQREKDIVVPLFCTSKQADLLTRLRAVHAGSSGFIQKPIDPFYLSKTLDQVCGVATNEPFRILIVDDSQSLAEYYKLILQGAGMICRAISNPLEAMDVMMEFQPDLLLLDIYMPDVSGIELAAVLRQELRYTHVPIIFLSSEEDKFKQLAALSLGGDDFLTKPILPQHLVVAVKSRAERAGILSSYMVRDSLTGLLNHSNILNQLDIELTRAERHNLTLSFAMLDIDHFKEINDKYGHMMGDRVLKRLSELLTTRLRKTDYVGRYGGEEFAIILPNTTGEDSERILDEIRDKFAGMVFHANETEFSVKFSVGIASYPDITNSQQLIEAADQALYSAKQSGRNKVKLFLTGARQR
jgi:diguanylate cyclase (GGDEF)-like protein